MKSFDSVESLRSIPRAQKAPKKHTSFTDFLETRFGSLLGGPPLSSPVAQRTLPSAYVCANQVSIFVGSHGRSEVTVCLLVTCGNRLLAAKNHQVRARRAVVGCVVKQITPLDGRSRGLALPSVDHAQHVAGIQLLGLQGASAASISCSASVSISRRS